MDILDRIDQLRRLILDQIVLAAKAGNTAALNNNNRKLQELEAIRNRVVEIEAKITSFPENSTSIELEADGSTLQTRVQPNKYITRRDNLRRAENYRTVFINDCRNKGIRLSKERGKRLFKLENKGIIGITFSVDHGDKWFLGLPTIKYYALVFICEKEQKTLRFIIPQNFFSIYNKYFSSSGYEYKFYISHIHGEYYMVLPDAGAQKITQYLDNFNAL